MMPLFLLYGGEIVIAIVVTRIVIWIVRSGGLRLPRDPGPAGPEGPRGVPRMLPTPPVAAQGAATPTGDRKAA